MIAAEQSKSGQTTDFVAYVRSKAKEKGIDLDKLVSGEVVPFPERRTLKGEYELTEEELRVHNRELADIEESQEQCSLCRDRNSCSHKAGWLNVAVMADCSGGSFGMRFGPCKFQQREAREKSIKKLMNSAHIPVCYQNDTWDDYEYLEGNNRALLLATKAVKNNRSLYFYGEVGTGKTKLVSIMANEKVKLGLPALFVSLTELFSALKDGFDKHDQGGRLLPLVKEAECLILDDMGATQFTEWNVGVIQEIIDYRYANDLQTIVTSNYSLTELKEHLVIRKHGKVVDDKQASRITSRLEEMCQQAQLDTPSFRKREGA